MTGLIFVAVSLNRDRIAGNPHLSAIAVQTLMLFLLPLGIAIMITAPGQASWVVGTELMAVGGLAAIVIARAERRKKRSSSGTDADSRLAQLLDHNSPNLLTTALTVIAGLTVVIGHGGGLYWVIPAVFFALVGGVVNAWLLLIRKPVGAIAIARCHSRRRRWFGSMRAAADQLFIPACAFASPALRSLTLLPSISANEVLGEFVTALRTAPASS